MVILYSTPTCAPCRTAARVMDGKGVEFDKVDLTEHPERLADLKARLKTDTLSTPTFEYQGTLYQGMNRLQEVIALAQAA